jgi:hypothetical protein
MIEVRPSLLCASGLAVGVLAATLVGIDPRAAGAQQSVEVFEQWAVIHAVPIETVEPTSSVAEAPRADDWNLCLANIPRVTTDRRLEPRRCRLASNADDLIAHRAT